MTITIDRVQERVELHTFNELPYAIATGEFDWVLSDPSLDPDGTDLDYPRFFNAYGRWWDAMEMLPVTGQLADAGWDAMTADSFFSGCALRWLDGDDDGFVMVGRIIA